MRKDSRLVKIQRNVDVLAVEYVDIWEKFYYLCNDVLGILNPGYKRVALVKDALKERDAEIRKVDMRLIKQINQKINSSISKTGNPFAMFETPLFNNPYLRGKGRVIFYDLHEKVFEIMPERTMSATFGSISDLVQEIKAYCRDIWREDLSKKVDKAFDIYSRRYEVLLKLCNKNIKLAQSLDESYDVRSKGIQWGLNWSNGAQLRSSKSFGSTTVHFDIRSNFNPEEALIGKRRIAEIIIQQCDKELLRRDISDAQRQRLLQIRNSKPPDMEKGILSTVRDFLIDIIEHNRYLLRLSRVNIHVIINNYLSSEYMGEYSEHSTLDNLFITIQLSEDLVLRYVHGAGISSNLIPYEQTYPRLVHELTHAYDIAGRYQPSDFRVLKTIIGEDPNLRTCDLLSFCIKNKREGIATFAEKFKGSILQFKDGKVAIYDYDTKYFEKYHMNEALERHMQGILHGILSKIPLDEFMLPYTLGEYMVVAMLIASMPMEYYVSPWPMYKVFARSKQNPNVTFQQALFNSEYWGNQMYRVGHSKMHNERLIGGRIQFVIKEKHFRRVEQFIKKISLMSIGTFYVKYLEACDKEKVSYGPLSKEVLIRFNEDAGQQTARALSAMGFR